MQAEQFLQQQFTALRQEIMARQMRMFWIAVMGLLGLPMLTYFAATGTWIVLLLVPYFVLVLIIMFVAEHNEMMRAGRYIREHIEPSVGYSPGWEKWLESNPQFRILERQFFACFIIVFFVYYFIAIGLAIQHLWGEAESDPSGLYWYWVYGAISTYTIGAIWAVSTLVQHWRFSVSTSD